MNIYSYTIKLVDPIFFAREGISGAFTPPYLHATALNHAFASAMGQSRNDQSYLMTDDSGSRNNPCYESSLIDKEFYLTPARLHGSPNYYTEIVKGDVDKNIQFRYGESKFEGRYIKRRFHNELLKAYRIYSIAPESFFEGYLFTILDTIRLPRLIRLGSFRGLASFEINGPIKKVGKERKKYCDHPVDPLVNKVQKGIAIPMLPYPIVDQAMVDEVWEIRKFRLRVFVASLPNDENEKIEPIKNSSSIII